MSVVEFLIKNIDQVSIKLHNGPRLTKPSADANTSDRGERPHHLQFGVLYVDRASEQTALVSDATCSATRHDPSRGDS